MPLWIALFLGSLGACAALAVGRRAYRRRRRYAEEWQALVDPVPRLLNVALLLFAAITAVGLVQCIMTAGEPRPGDVKVASTIGSGAAKKTATPRPADPRRLKALMERLRPLHAPLGPPEDGPWLCAQSVWPR